MDGRHATSSGEGVRPCGCTVARHQTRFIVVTGGPGAGKTAMLELAKHHFCKHVRVLPEVATMLFGGGFPRDDEEDVQRAAQSAICKVQRELEIASAATGHVAVALCDRGTLDGIAYWPGSAASFLERQGMSEADEYARYDAVIHLRTPTAAHYNHVNSLRLESAASARVLDERILEIWARHPNRHIVESSDRFLDKASRALSLLEDTLPTCCRR